MEVIRVLLLVNAMALRDVCRRGGLPREVRVVSADAQEEVTYRTAAAAARGLSAVATAALAQRFRAGRLALGRLLLNRLDASTLLLKRQPVLPAALPPFEDCLVWRR
jgi:hypothetical protein